MAFSTKLFIKVLTAVYSSVNKTASKTELMNFSTVYTYYITFAVYGIVLLFATFTEKFSLEAGWLGDFEPFKGLNHVWF
jgi:hypothetical protein